MITIKKIFSIVVLTLTLAMCNTTPRPPRQVEVKFTVDMSSPQLPVGEFETNIRRTFPLTGLRGIVVTVSYFPYEDAVCLNYRSDFFSYNQFWSLSGREAYIKAIKNYNEEYTSRSLDTADRNSKSKYGTVEGYLVWQMASFTRRVSANMNVDLGYTFFEQQGTRTAFYTVTQKHTTYVDPISEEDDMDSQEITMHFTRAQAQVLADLFDQEFLLALVPPEMRGRRNPVNPNVDWDDYFNDYFDDGYNDDNYHEDGNYEADNYEADFYEADNYEAD